MDKVKKHGQEAFNLLLTSYRIYHTYSIHLLPAYIAFFTLWSVVPILYLWDFIVKLVPNSANNIHNFSALNTYIQHSDITFSISNWNIAAFVVIVYLSSKALLSIINASNYIYGVEDKTNYIRIKIKSFSLALLLMLTLILLLIIPVLGNQLLLMIESVVGTHRIFTSLRYLQMPLTIGYIVVVLFIIYATSPAQKMKAKYFVPGTLFTTAGWLIASVGYSVYLNVFADYSKVYNTFSTVISLMIWLYLISYILVLGLVLNAAFFEREQNKITSIA